MAQGKARFRTRHLVAVSVGGMLIAFTIGIGLTLALKRSADDANAARIVAMGTIGRTHLGRKHDVAEIAWQDYRHTPHVARLRMYSPNDWPQGEAFEVSYDPDDPGGPVHAGPGYTDYVEDVPLPTWAGPFAAVACLAFLASWWLVRGLLYRRAKSAPVSEWRVRLRLETRRRIAGSVLLSLTPVEGAITPIDQYWQRVMWSPALAELSDDRIVRVRHRPGFFGRAVIEAPDGSFIWPVGRLRTLLPGRWTFPLPWPPSWGFERPRVSRLLLGFFLVIPLLAAIREAHGVPELDLSFAALAACVYGVWLHIWGWSGGVLAIVPRGLPQTFGGVTQRDDRHTPHTDPRT